MTSAEASSGVTAETAVKEICSKPVVTVNQFATMDHAACHMQKQRISSLAVVDEVGRCIGLLTATDFIAYSALKSGFCPDEWMSADRKLERDESGTLRISDVPNNSVLRHLSSPLQTAPEAMTVAEARIRMRRQRIHHLLILDSKQRPVGVVSAWDLL